MSFEPDARIPTFSPKFVLDTLSTSIGTISQQTRNYRLRGTDTMTWDDQNYWIEIKGITGLLSLPEGHPGEEFIEALAIKYGALLEASSFLDHMHQIEEIYSCRHAMAVRRFLYAYPQLVEVLLEAYPYLVKHFGPNPQVMLKVVRDPEAGRSEQLMAYILTSLDADEALIRLDRLDEEWFMDQFDRVGDLFNFNL